MSETVFGLVCVYFAIGVLFAGDDCWRRPKGCLLDRPIWREFLSRLFFWPFYALHFMLLVVVAIILIVIFGVIDNDKL